MPSTDGMQNAVVARSFEDAVHYVEQHGPMSFVSFDHDLGDQVPSGYDFAKWLVETDMDHGGEFLPRDFAFNVHSANGPGASNISGLLRRYLDFKIRSA